MSHQEYFNLPLADDTGSGAPNKYFVLIIYDITDNRRRARLAKLLESFGYRVQDSAFEAMLTKRQLAKLMDKIEKFSVHNEIVDSIRIYRIRGIGEVTFYGFGHLPPTEDLVFI